MDNNEKTLRSGNSLEDTLELEEDTLEVKNTTYENKQISEKLSRGSKLKVLDMDCVIVDILSGGMGVVYICKEILTGIPIVLKTSSIKNAKFEEALRWEAEVWVKLGYHKNIVQALGVEKIFNTLFIILEYVEPYQCKKIKLRNLKDWIAVGLLGKENLVRVIDFAIQFCNGIIYAQDKFYQEQRTPFIHRDIKSTNILVSKEGILKITDFGLVQALFQIEEPLFRQFKEQKLLDTEVTMEGTICGTPLYMAPEVWEGNPDIDERTDIYSFGCTMYEMITGSPPFLYPFERLRKAHLIDLPKPIEGIPQELNKIVLKCLEKDQKDRYSSFFELKEDLCKFYLNITGQEYPINEIQYEESAQYYLHAGLDLEKLGKFKEAIDYYEKASKVDPENYEAYYYKGKICKKLKMYQRALNDFSNALKFNPKFAKGYLERGLIYLELSKSSLAKEDFKKFIKFASVKDFALINLVKKMLEKLE